MRINKLKILCVFAIVIASLMGSEGYSEAAFKVLNDDSLNLHQYNVDRREYIVNHHKIEIEIRKMTNADDFLTITRDGRSIHNQRISHHWGHRVFRVKDISTQREFFILDMIKRSLLMGYDEENGKWNVYVDSDNYYNAVDGEPWISVISGNLYLTYQQEGIRTKEQVYHLEWDDNANWFNYIDEGIQ